MRGNKKTYLSIFGISLLALAMLVISLIYDVRKKDPFFYLHQTPLLPFLKWQANKLNEISSGRFSGNNIPAPSKNVYALVQNQSIHFRKLFYFPASTVPDKNKPSCEDVFIENVNGGQILISSSSLQENSQAGCIYKIENIYFSDDESVLAVQLENWNDESDSVFKVFSISNEGAIVHASIVGRLKHPVPFTFDGGLLYVDPKTAFDLNGACKIKKWLDGNSSCELQRQAVPESETDSYISVFRAKNHSQTWVIFSKFSEDKGTVYQWKKRGTDDVFETTEVKNVSRIAATSKGFIYSRVGKENDESKASQANLILYRPQLPETSLVTAPASKIKWVANGNGAFALIVGDSKNSTQLFKIDAEGVQHLDANGLPIDASEIDFLRGSHSPLPRFRIESNSGNVMYGVLEASGRFVAEQTKSYPFETELQKFVWKSRDGTQIPCRILRKKGSSQAMPAIVRVYGSYGSILRPRLDGVSAAILNENIALVFAHVRGGGELGDSWAESGRGINKRNTVFDTEACVNGAIEKKWIAAGEILMHGVSAGAVPAMMVALRNPEIIKGAWVDVPFLDSSGQHHNDPIDDHEFGKIEDSQEAESRLLWSPYQNLLKGSLAKGAFLFTCGERDLRIPIWHCIKSHAAIETFHPNRSSYVWVSKNLDHFSGALDSLEQQRKDDVVLDFIFSTLSEGQAQLHKTPSASAKVSER